MTLARAERATGPCALGTPRGSLEQIEGDRMAVALGARARRAGGDRRDMLPRIMTGRLAGRVTQITGAAPGQRAAEVRWFAAEKARVVLSDLA